MKNNWRKYNSALIPNIPPHISMTNSTEEMLKLLRESNSLFARYTTNFDISKQKLFWYVINDKSLSINDYDVKTRNQVRKGLKMCSVRIISKKEFSEYGYEVYSKAFKKYKTFNKMDSKRIFDTEINNLTSDYDLWGVFSLEGDLIGYSKNYIQKNVCEFSSTKFHPQFLKCRPSEALFHTMCTYYMKEKKFHYIHNGTKSIAHHTNIQDFLIKKFKFRKAFCTLHICYSPSVKFIVKILYPFRKIISKSRIKLLQKIAIVLFQEEIRRNQQYE